MNVMVKRLATGLVATSVFVATLAAAAADLRLVEAAKTRNREAVRSLLQESVDVNATQLDGASALAWAAHWNDLETAEILIRAGADSNLANDYGVTPLLLACGKGSSDMVQKLLNAGADPNAAQWMGVTPLMICSRSGNLDAVKLLLTHEADPRAKDNRRGQTALMWAAARQHLEVARLLLEYGAAINTATHMPAGLEQRMFLTYGVQRRDPTRPDTLGAEDIHPDPTSSMGGFTALMFAARQGDVAMGRLLVAAGADVNHFSPEYGSPLVVAAANGHESLSLFLLEQGANPNVEDVWGFTPLHYALREGIAAIGMSRRVIPSDRDWMRSNMGGLVESLLQHGADPNARVGDGIPPFDYPAFARTTGNSMPELRQPGATPFLLAAASLDAGLMRLLVAHGADPLLTTREGTTPLMVAAGMGRLEAFTTREEVMALDASRLAWELGSDVNASNQDGRTALAAAAYKGAEHIIQFLVDKGAALETKDRYGQTALSIALGIRPNINGNDKRFRGSSPHKRAANLLLSLGAKPIQDTPPTGQ